jgi:putative ABC transport system permease protein
MRDWAAYIRERLANEAAAQGGSAGPIDANREARVAQETIDELAAHLDDVYREALRSGASQEQARIAAVNELDAMGPLARALARRGPFNAPRPRRDAQMRALVGDLTHGFRLLRLRPGISLVIALTLAVGIGLSVAVFSMHDAVLGRALPYADPTKLVLVWESDANNRTDAGSNIVAAPVYEDWRQRSRTLANLGIWEYIRANISGGADPDQVPAARASASFFETLGVQPALGRTFTAAEDEPGHRVVVISDAVWRSQFAADNAVLGRSLRVNDIDYTVIGVMPPRFAFPMSTTGVWLPIAYTPGDHQRGSHSFYVVGRLAQGSTMADADAEFARIGADLAKTHTENLGESATVSPLGTFGMQMMSRILGALAGAVAFVLLIACVNVANLQIGLAFARRREFVVRLALGAGIGRIARQLFAEGIALAAAGGAAGIGLAWLITRALDRIVGPNFFTLPFRGQVPIGIDGRTLAFAVAVSIGCALLFSFAPLLGLRREAMAPALQSGARGVTRSALGLRRTLVAAEVAMAIIVLSGAGLLIKSFSNLLGVDSGLRPDRVIGMQVSVPQKDTYGPGERATFCEDTTRAAAPGPGRVFSAFGAISHVPLSGANAGRGLAIEGFTPADPNDEPSAFYRIICPGYFETLGIPVAPGRDIASSDRAPVVVVNRAFADKFWPRLDPVGRRIKITYGDNPWMTVVGVAGNVKHYGLDQEVRPEIYVSYRLNAWPSMTLVARTSGEITPAARLAMGDVIRQSYPGLPAGRVWTMASVVGDSLQTRASLMRMLLIFAGVGLMLSAIGVYGVLAHYVSQRGRELGVRVALGCSRAGIVGLVLGQSMAPMLAGAAAGLVASLWTNRMLAAALFKTTPHDAAVLATITMLVIAVGVAASWIPAHRAAGVDPTLALKD